MFEVTVKTKTAYELSYENHAYIRDFSGSTKISENYMTCEDMMNRYKSLKHNKSFRNFNACKKEHIDLDEIEKVGSQVNWR